ncbi:hypothetical protein [Enterococcus sp. 5H]|uniref:hypothetical protein n=1 Tax=Enterococcus sp. 5H TaxID=1229490 RepID=UPI002302C73F|nr:hypothetical protein [Enterococcus sp. 5H]MDA9472569.1 hypothetical protein [Enterococcus sp. 5H]
MKFLSKQRVIVLIMIGGFLFIGNISKAASLTDAEKSISNGSGEIVHPNLYRDLTPEEKESFKDWPTSPVKINRNMTKEEAIEYFDYIEKYQQKNNTSEVPQKAYDYIQYITERLDVSQTSEITDELRLDAEKYVENLGKEYPVENKVNNKKLVDNKETKQKKSFWDNLFNFNWFK